MFCPFLYFSLQEPPSMPTRIVGNNIMAWVLHWRLLLLGNYPPFIVWLLMCEYYIQINPCNVHAPVAYSPSFSEIYLVVVGNSFHVYHIQFRWVNKTMCIYYYIYVRMCFMDLDTTTIHIICYSTIMWAYKLLDVFVFYICFTCLVLPYVCTALLSNGSRSALYFICLPVYFVGSFLWY